MVRIIGACCIFAGCGGFGFSMAAASRREEGELRQLLAALEYMSCELSYRMTPLSVLCRTAAEGSGGTVRAFLTELARELDTLGRFDLPGQLRGLESAIRSTEEALRQLRDGAADRRRSYQTLGLCAGAAMAILFL